MSEADVAEAYSRYGPLVLQRCRRILGNEAAAKDALQEVFLRVWRHAEAFQNANSKVAWLYRVAERCCFNHMSRRATRTQRLPVDAPEPWVRSHAGRVEDGEFVLKFLSELDEKLRQVAILHYLDGMGQEEIATAAGCSRQTVVNRLTAIKAQVRMFRERGLWETKAS